MRERRTRRRPTGAVPRRDVSPEATGGAGYNFEDEVSAWFAVQLLAGAMPLGTSDGVPVKMQWQAGALGWQLDDLVVSMQTGTDTSQQLSISIKSNKQVTRKGFHRSFVRAAWAQWLATDEGPFRKDRDLLGLATPTLADDVRRSWETLANQAREAAPGVMAKRLRQAGASSRVARALFDSVRCPREVSGKLANDAEAAVLMLRRLRLLSFDFRAPDSTRRSEALEACQRLLQSGDPREAASLWRDLVAIAATKRQAGGTTDRSELAAALVPRFELQAWPDLRSDWQSIRQFSHERAARILTTIAGRFAVQRVVETDQVRTTLVERSSVVVVGDPGVGKSALLRTALSGDSGTLDEGVIWLDPPALERSGLDAITAELRLRHPLVKVMEETAYSRPVLVLDAVEQYGEGAHACAQALVSAVSRLPRWRIALTIRRESADVADEILTRAGAVAGSGATIEVPAPSDQQIRQLLSSLPQVRSLAKQPGVAELLRSFKVLDWLADAALSSPGNEGRLTHSSLLDWIWSTWMGRGPDRYARAGLLKRLAGFEADEFTSGTPLSVLDAAEARVLADLERLALLSVEGERAYFRHDLLGDVARQKRLEEDAGSAAAIADRARSPRWHHAIRLYGQARLESDGVDAWRKLAEKLPESEGGRIARDLLLEAIITSSNVRDLLEDLWPDLSKAPSLLPRLLRRFGWIASRPSPVLQMAELDRATADALAPHVRVPYWPYWPAFLDFLVTHVTELVLWVPRPTAELVVLFLRTIPAGVRGRAEAARIAVKLARAVVADTPVGRHEDEDRVLAFEALLLAAPEVPDEVLGLTERLVRVPVLIAESDYPPLLRPSVSGPRSVFVTDAAFRQALLKADNLIRLASVRPEAAAQLLLDACKEGDPENDYLNNLDAFGDRRLGIDEGDWGLNSPLFDQGPFLGLLRQDGEAGLRCAIDLVNHATASWAKYERAAAPVVPICVDGTWVDWIGDHRLFGWYRHILMGSRLVASCLMAVEKWLYEQSEAGRDVGPAIERILRDSRSVAFLGVLTALALKTPAMLKGPLLPLVSSWRVFELQEWLLRNDNVFGLELMRFVRLGEMAFNAARDWHTLPHRKLSLQELVVRLMLTEPDFAASLEGIRRQWASRLGTAEHGDRDTLELFAARFDPSNYQVSRQPEGRLAVRLVLPEHLRGKTEEALARSSEDLDLLTFPFRCQEALKDGSTLDTDPEAVWATLQRWDNDDDRSSPPDDQRRRFDALAAGAALLWLRHREWLKARPDVEEWCLQAAELPARIGAPKEAFADEALAFAPFSWLSSAAQVSIGRLSEMVEDTIARELAASAVTTPSSEATAVALERAFRLRAMLGVEFSRLVNLAVVWASLRLALVALARTDGSDTLANHWRARLISAFVARRLPSSRMSWSRLSKVSHRLYVRLMRRIYPKMPLQRRPRHQGRGASRYRPRLGSGFDFECLEAALRWLPGLERATSPEERAAWLELHEEFLSVSMAMMPTIDEPNVEVEDAPHRIEYALYDRLCPAILHLRSDEQHQRLWTPILDLGGAALAWVRGFLDRWFLAGPAAAPSPARFFERWKDFLDYAFASRAWQRGSGWHVGELWHHLLGMSGPSQLLKDQTYAGELARLAPYFERWCARWLDLPESGSEFAWCLAQPGARSLREPGLHWLSEAVDKYDERAWENERQLEERLADLLRVSWLGLGPGFGGHVVTRTAFLKLLAKITERGSPAALDLRDRVRRSVRALEL